MNKQMQKVLMLLVSVQFIFTLDTTFMNVSISTLVKDLQTTVTGVQSAIVLYTLVMAAFMIAGAKLGDIIGRRRAFIIGLSVYATGSLVTSLAPNIYILTLGWSVLEGLGAALAIPAMFSLITGNFAAGPARSRAYGQLAAMAAIGAAVGPIVGGLLTSYASWRLGFAGEVVIAGVVLLNRRLIKDAPIAGIRPKFDFGGLILSVAGLVILVYGILLANTYGIFKARADYSLFGIQLAHKGGLAPTVILSIIGLAILGLFLVWETWRTSRARATLVSPKLFKIRTVKAGISSIGIQQFIMAGVIFSLSLVLQLSLGYSAFKTGLTILPLSVLLLFGAGVGSRINSTYKPRSIVLVGFGLLFLGVVFLGLRASHLTTGMEAFLPLVLMGAGLGFTASQLGNLIQSSVSLDYTNEASGLSSTFQNLGSSLGTALAGSIMIAVLISSSQSLIASNNVLSPGQKQQYQAALEKGIQVVSNQQVETQLSGQPDYVVQEVVEINAQARTKALSWAIVALGLIGASGLVSAWFLPRQEALAEKP